MDDDGSARPIFIPASGIALLSILTLFVISRFIGRCSGKTGQFGISDLFVGIGWTCAVALTSIAVYASLTRDLSNHIAHVSEIEDQTTVAFYAVVIDGLFFFGVSCVKLSIFLWYHHLIAERNDGVRALRWVIRVLAALVALSSVAYLIVPFIGCQPLEALWRRVDPAYLTPYKCIDFFLAAVVIGAFEMMTDLSACIIPLVIISQRRTMFKYKTGTAVVLLLVIVATAAGAVRVWQVHTLYDDNDDDWTWLRALVNLNAIIRIHLLLICACAPFAYKALQPATDHVRLKLQLTRNNRLHATEHLDKVNDPGYWSLRSKSPLPPQIKPPMRGVRDSFTVRKLRKKIPAHALGDLEAGTFSGNKAGKRKSSPIPLVLTGVPPKPMERSLDQQSQFEITVAYTPSLQTMPQTHMAEMQSPTLPPDFLIRRNRLSNMSWMTGKSKQSRWSSTLSTSTITSLSPRLNRARGSNTARRLSTSTPYSPGLSTIDLGDLPDIHALPGMPEMSAMRSARLPCAVCGKFHPKSYRHSDAEAGKAATRFALWRSSEATTTRQSQSTFYHEDDDEDEAVLRRGAVRERWIGTN